MRKFTKFVLIMFILLISIMLALTSPKDEREVVEKVSCPVANSTYSFCFIRDGKHYYFSVLGWVSPNATIMERYIKLLYAKHFEVTWGGAFSSYGYGVLLFLAIKTNLDLGSLAVEVRVNNLYKQCMLGCADCSIRVGNDIFLIPFALEVDDFWESYKIVKEYYINTTSVRLHLNIRNAFLDLKENHVVRIGEIAVVSGISNSFDIYVKYPPPKFNLSIVSIEFLKKDDYYIFNITFRINDAGFITRYFFNEFGRKYALKEVFVPLYLLTVERIPTKDIWTVKKINETHYLVAIPTATGNLFAIRYHFGGSFRDVWIEPQHKYIASYVSSGNVFWLEIEVWHEYIINNTVIFVTPWSRERLTLRFSTK